MQTCHYFRRCTLLILYFFGLVLLPAVIQTNTSLARSDLPEKADSIPALTHTLYLPVIHNEPICANLPGDTVAILGQATIHGNPAGPNIPFALFYRAHWEYPPSYVLTMTTRNDGSFCSGPVNVLSYCYGTWYEIYGPNASWQGQVSACEAGKVYTITAEIGE